MFAAPGLTPLAILADDDSQSYAGATLTFLAFFAQLQQLFTQRVSSHNPRRGLNNSNRGRRSWRAITWCNDDPCSIGPPHITTILVVIITTWPRLTLYGNGTAG
jgi:hypothetical protein